MLFAPPDYLAFSRMLVHDLRVAAWLMGTAVVVGAYVWWRRNRREEEESGPLDLAS